MVLAVLCETLAPIEMQQQQQQQQQTSLSPWKCSFECWQRHECPYKWKWKQKQQLYGINTNGKQRSDGKLRKENIELEWSRWEAIGILFLFCFCFAVGNNSDGLFVKQRRKYITVVNVSSVSILVDGYPALPRCKKKKSCLNIRQQSPGDVTVSAAAVWGLYAINQSVAA